MESNLTLTPNFGAGVFQNGVPSLNKDGFWTIGGYIDVTNTQQATFGKAVSIVTGTDPYSFVMGFPGSSTFAGILINENAININDPAKPNYLLNGQPATAIYFGQFWIESYNKTAVGAIDPVASAVIIANNTTGELQFIANGTSVPVGWTVIKARVVTTNARQGTLIFMGESAFETQQTSMFESDATHAINFQNTPIGTNTDGSLISTGSNWLTSATAGATMVKLLCDYTATSGDEATMRLRARSSGVNAAGGVIAGNFAASANINDYANLYAVQGYAQPLTFTQANASNILCGVYSCVDRSVATAGRSWSLWTDTHETITATGSHYLHRLSNNGVGLTLNGIWTIYAGAGATYLMNFENTNAPVVSGDKTGGAKDYSLAVYIDGAVRYIQTYS